VSSPLRGCVLVAGGALVVLGVVLMRWGSGLAPLLLGLLILASLLLEGRYRRASAGEVPSGPDWERTGETFHDAESGHWVQVWYNSKSGERRYVPEEPPSP
jgi:hypothetical protein